MGYNRSPKMKRIFFLLLPLLFFNSCATYNLNKSIWYNLSFVEKDGQKADLTTSLHFVSEDQVDVFCSVVSDTAIIVTPFKYAEGKYSVSGDPKKKAEIKIDAITINGKKMNLVGAYRKNDCMTILSQDSVFKVYTKLSKIKNN